VRFEREFVPKTSPGLKIGLTTFRARVAEIVGGDREVAEEPAAMDSSARDVLDHLTSEKTYLADLLVDAVHGRVRSIASQRIIDNLDTGLNRVLGPGGQALCKAHPAREWLDSSLRTLAQDFADHFAEPVMLAADEACQEWDARQAEIVAREQREAAAAGGGY